MFSTVGAAGVECVNMSMFRVMAETPQEEQRVLSKFFELTEHQLFLMKNFRAAEDMQDWAIAAHYIKGAAANLGMTKLAQACAEAENTRDATHFPALRQGIEQAVEELKQFFESRTEE